MKGRIVGSDGDFGKWLRLPRPDLTRHVKDDFMRTTTDQFLDGTGGNWWFLFEQQHKTPAPWASISPRQLEEAYAHALQISGLDAHVERKSLDITSDVMTRVHVKLELHATSKLTDREVYAMFAAAWPAKIPLPQVSIGIDISAEADRAPGEPKIANTTALKRLFEVDAGQVRIDSDQFSPEEKKRLELWSRSVMPGAKKPILARQLLALLSAPTDLSTEKGRSTIAALKELELFSKFWNAGMDLLAARFKPRQLERSVFVYNGHPTFAMTSMLPTLNAFAPAATNIWVSKRSGTPEAREIIRIQKPSAMFAETNIGPKWSIGDFLDQKMRMPQEDWGTHHMIVDKLGPWIEKKKGAIPRQVVNGWVRAIVHNRDDIDALKNIEQFIWGVDFANSDVKKMEARFIGEQFALMGAREARVKGWGRIGDLPVVINGFGLLGEQTALALNRLGMPREKIIVRDLDPEVLARAKGDGFCIEAERPEKCVVFNATPGAGFTRYNAGEFGDDLIVLSMTSGGKGVDLGGYQGAKEVPVARRSQQPIRDLDLEIPWRDGKKIQVRVIAEGQPPNLVDEMWADRYQLTSMGVSAAALQAAELEKPGVVKFDPVLDQTLVNAAEACGLFAKRPLEARPGEDPRALLADLDAFDSQ